jgi:GntR family transcriptional regulator
VELARRQGCSLITVRHALAELAREGRVKRVPGRGTFVQAPPIERDLATIRSFTEEMHRRGWDHETRLIGAREESADLAVAEALRLPIGAPVLHLERVRLAAGAPLLLEHVYLSKDRYEGILAEDLERSSLYELLASRFGIQLIRAHETIEPVLPSRRDARLLGQSSRQPALLLEGTTYTYNDVPVEYCRALVRGDRARYHVEAGGLRCDAVVPSENGQGVTW